MPHMVGAHGGCAVDLASLLLAVALLRLVVVPCLNAHKRHVRDPPPLPITLLVFAPLHLDLYFYLDLAMEADRDLRSPQYHEGLLVHHDPAIYLEIQLALVQSVRHIGVSDRSEQLPVLPSADMEHHGDAFQLRRAAASL